jgi:hypothetical protein
VCPAKYRRAVIDEKVDQVLKEVCLEIADRYQVEFLEIGTDKDHNNDQKSHRTRSICVSALRQEATVGR